MVKEHGRLELQTTDNLNLDAGNSIFLGDHRTKTNLKLTERQTTDCFVKLSNLKSKGYAGNMGRAYLWLKATKKLQAMCRHQQQFQRDE